MYNSWSILLLLLSCAAEMVVVVVAWKEEVSQAALLPLRSKMQSSLSSTFFLPNNNNNNNKSFRFQTQFMVRGGAGGIDSESLEQQHYCETGVKPSPYIVSPPVWGHEKRALIIMDAFSHYHGLYLSHRAKEIYGVATVIVFSDYMKGYFLKEQPEDLDQLLSMCMPPLVAMEKQDQDENVFEEWIQHLENYELVGIVCESDSGLADAERLGNALNLTHHDGINESRRNKFLMNQAVAEHGLPVVRQRLCQTAAEAQEFATSILGMSNDGIQASNMTTSATVDQGNRCRVVVKPIRGVASDDVFLCNDSESIQEAVLKIQGSTVFGSPTMKHESVLVQEFAVGQEYAIDVISKNGQHKVAAIWKYDKRPANGAPFVYYATRLFDDQNGDLSSSIFIYVQNCLDALGVRWGITHNEIIVTAEGPRLVEVNCRQHNMDFIPIAMECIGYNAFDMLLSAYLGDKNPTTYPPLTEDQRLEWDLLPDIPSTRANGAMVHLVNSADGKLIKVNEEALKEIQSMESVLDLEVYGPFLEIGERIVPTCDIRSDAGWVQLVNDDGDAFKRDYDRIIELMPTLFEVDDAV